LLKFSPARLVLVDRSENGLFFLEQGLLRMHPEASFEVCVADVLDEPRMTRVFQEHRPEIVFHAAAYKHVPLMESHPGEAVKNIITATKKIANLSDAHGVESFVLISTDKAVSPTSVMGACKRVAELYVQSLAEQSSCRFVTVRFGNVLDSAGSVVQVFREQIARGGPVTVTHPDMKRFFMTIPEAARLVIQAGAIGNPGRILTLDMGQPVSVADLAADMIRLSGLRLGEDIEIEYTGLRPGEKLIEQLHLPGERALPTSHPSITEAEHQTARHGNLEDIIHQLEQASVWSPGEIIGQLQQAVPEYRRDGMHEKLRRAA
jgi:FlaA1/EpsC-like NDP-sugar epimerase